MDGSYDVVILGAGLAGACAALRLSESRSVLVVDRGDVASGASGAGAGLVNPMMARKARPVWRCREALDALELLLDESDARDLFRQTGVLRPAIDQKQAEHFRVSASENRDLAEWLEPQLATVRCPQAASPFGALWVHRGGSVSIPGFVRACLRKVVDRGGRIETGRPVHEIHERADGVVIVSGQSRWHAERALLCLGADHNMLAGIPEAPLHRIKGQTAVVETPPELESIPCLSSGVYVVPGNRRLTVGSSFEHAFTDLRPDPSQTEKILSKATRVLPGIAPARLLEERAGVRATVPVTRLPIIGPIPAKRRTWMFNGLGSKGLLLAPLLARGLPDFLTDPAQIPREVAVDRQKSA
jgi:glycine oxidase